MPKLKVKVAGAWVEVGAGLAGIAVQSTAPTNPTENMLWLDVSVVDSPVLKIRKADVWVVVVTNGADGADGADGSSGIGTSYILSSNVSSTVTALADVSEWSFDVVAGKTYRIEIIANYQTGVTSTGGKLAVYLPSGAGSIHGFLVGSISSNVAATEQKVTLRVIGASNLSGSYLVTTAVNVINTPHYIGGSIIFNCTTSGIFRVQWASEIDSTAARLNAGGAMIVSLLN